MRLLNQRALLALTLALLALPFLPAPASATWSIIAVDSRNNLVVISSATCVTAEGLRRRGGLMSIQAVIVPGIGVAAAQAGVDGTRANQTLIFEEMAKGTDPDDILRMLSEDENFQSVSGKLLRSCHRGLGADTEGPRRMERLP